LASSPHALPPWLAAIACAALLALIGWLDYLTGKQASFTLLYLLPISLAKWFVGRRAGLICCIIAALIGLAVGLNDNPSLPTELWNAGIRLGVYLTFFSLLRQVRLQAGSDTSRLRGLQRLLILSATSACALAAAGWLLQRYLPSANPTGGASTPALAASDPQRALADLAPLIQRTMRASRPVLLGSRDPQGPSCVAVVNTGDLRGKVPDSPGELNG